MSSGKLEFIWKMYSCLFPNREELCAGQSLKDRRIPSWLSRAEYVFGAFSHLPYWLSLQAGEGAFLLHIEQELIYFLTNVSQFAPRLIYRNASCKTDGGVWLVTKTFYSTVNSPAFSLLKHLQLCFCPQLWFVLDDFWLHVPILICGVFDTPPPKAGHA